MLIKKADQYGPSKLQHNAKAIRILLNNLLIMLNYH